MVIVVDYGLGNLRSVVGAIERLGHEARISGTPADLADASHLVLPGVGAFRDGIANLNAGGLREALDREVRVAGKPVLGICLGAQLLARTSEEFGDHEGLGWIPASVRRIVPDDPTLRVPHVGWNAVSATGPSVLLDGVPDGALFYFVHSYQIRCDEPGVGVAACDYGGSITAVVEHGNVYGTQFHPEKSQQHGLTVLGNFLSRT